MCVQYIPKIYMHKIVVMLSVGWISVKHLLLSFRVTTLALGETDDCPDANKVTLKDMDEINFHLMTTKQTKHKPCPRFVGCVIYRIFLDVLYYLGYPVIPPLLILHIFSYIDYSV